MLIAQISGVSWLVSSEHVTGTSEALIVASECYGQAGQFVVLGTSWRQPGCLSPDVLGRPARSGIGYGRLCMTAAPATPTKWPDGSPPDHCHGTLARVSVGVGVGFVGWGCELDVDGFLGAALFLFCEVDEGTLVGLGGRGLQDAAGPQPAGPDDVDLGAVQGDLGAQEEPRHQPEHDGEE